MPKNVKNARLMRHKKRIRRDKMWSNIYKILLLIIILITAFFATTIFFKVTNIEVLGQTRYSHSDIISVCRIKSNDNLFFISKNYASKNILVKFPYISKIQIKRRLPGTVEINITESTPVAAMKYGLNYALIDENVKLLEEVSENVAYDYMQINGIDASIIKIGQNISMLENDQTNTFFNLFNILNDRELLPSVDFIDLTQCFDIKLGYKGKYIVELGDNNDLERKIRFMLSVESRLNPSDKGVIDLKSGGEARFRPENIQQ